MSQRLVAMKSKQKHEQLGQGESGMPTLYIREFGFRNELSDQEARVEYNS